jgi:hypothetical protein
MHLFHTDPWNRKFLETIAITPLDSFIIIYMD